MSGLNSTSMQLENFQHILVYVHCAFYIFMSNTNLVSQTRSIQNRQKYKTYQFIHQFRPETQYFSKSNIFLTNVSSSGSTTCT